MNWWEDIPEPKPGDPEPDAKEIDIEAVARVLRQAIGVTIPELQDDITERLRDPLLGFDLHLHLPFKEAKRLFKEAYIKSVLRLNFGNISEAARILELSRRTVHRLSEDEEVQQIRDEMRPGKYFRRQEVTSAITESLSDFSEVLHPKKIESVYEQVPKLSEELVDSVTQKPLTLKEATEEFERRYLRRALIRHGPLLKNVAKQTKLRYETLLRKLKQLEIEH